MLIIRNIIFTILLFVGNRLWKLYLFFRNKKIQGTNKKQLKRILIIATAGIGNCLLLIPALKNLRKILPKSQVSILVANSTTADIFRFTNLVDDVTIYDTSKIRKFPRFMKENYRFIRKLRREGFDLTMISYPVQDIATVGISFLSGASLRVGFSYLGGYLRNRCFLYTACLSMKKKKHEVEMNLDLIRLFGANNFDQDIEFPIFPEEEQFANEFLPSKKISNKDLLIGIHAGSTQKYKRWPLERFAALARQLSLEKDAKIILFGGKEEITLSQNIIKLANKNLINVTGKLTIRQTAALIKKCSLFISNDSGLMHLATAVKTPVIAIFGPTNYIKNSPYGKSHILIRKDLLCSPCHRPGLTDQDFKCKNRECFDLITVEDVLKAVDLQLNRIQRVTIIEE